MLKVENFVTMILVLLDPQKRTLIYSCAGHVPGYLIDADGGVSSTLGYTGIPLGVLRDYRYSASDEMNLDSGDILLLLTDGITEATGRDNIEFGSQRAIELVHQHRDHTAEGILARLFQSVESFSNHQFQEDDITSVICKIM